MLNVFFFKNCDIIKSARTKFKKKKEKDNIKQGLTNAFVFRRIGLFI